MVRPGYKQTEVGVIPEDWTVTEVGDISRIFGRIGFRGYTVDDIVEEGRGAISISPSNIQDNQMDFSSCTYVSWHKYNESPEIRIENGNILLVKTGSTVGKVAVVRQLPQLATINPQIVVLKKITANNLFLGYSMVFDTIQDQLSATVVGGALPTLSQSEIARFKLPLPPTKTEQEAIAGALSDADALIESLEELIAKKRQIKQGAMQELLTGNTRLPGFSGEWTMKQLGVIASIQRGASPRPIDSPIWFDANSQVGWVRISDVTSSSMYLRETTQYLSPLGIQHSRPVGRGSLIMSICATVGRAIITEIDACIHDGFVVFDSLRVDTRFLYYVLSFIESYWAQRGQTGSQMNLNTGLINRTEVHIPPTAGEQSAIVQILSDMDAELAALEIKHAKARQIKQGMMQELLTGRIRLV